ncbi:MAG: Dam family site-specific DNA-(adenine-N6)-methyltransferase, partial [Spirochaetaceae bacterium]|nr:Dam family site-specific DNA-(adenine-N6)-methyltransferase [Spirochaetaceae bacterium]
MGQERPVPRPFLKWAGGKRQLLAEILKNIPPVKDYTYYEPFVGAGAVFFALRPPRAVINDGNAQLMTTYRVIRDDVEALIAVLREHEKNNGAEYYYRIRDLDRDGPAFARLPEAEKAGRLIFLNKTCYNGLYRVNSRGLFNVPRGSYKQPRICEETLLRVVSAYLRDNDVTILQGDFAAALGGAGDRAVVYFDPPYHSPDRLHFTGYQPPGFGEAEQRRLRDCFFALTEGGAACLLSNADTEFIRGLYADPRCVLIPLRARRPINS